MQPAVQVISLYTTDVYVVVLMLLQSASVQITSNDSIHP